MGLRALAGWGIAEGQMAPEFSLMGSDSKFYSHRPQDGKKLIVYFFPKAFTTGCTAQACSFQSELKEISDLGYQLIGISTDPFPVLQKFDKEYSLAFPVLSDPTKEVCRAFEVLTPIGLANRVTFVINANGAITKVFRFVPWHSYAKRLLRQLSKHNA